MGVWSSAGKFFSKQAERAMLVFSGMQWGDSSNDSEKTVAAISSYQNLRSAQEKLAERQDHSALMYISGVLIFVIIIFMIVLCVKMLFESVKMSANVDQRQNNIQLSTLRTPNSSNSTL